jgi:phospholipid/cholesterol/gamma-HCH transport system substrate-binding protein
MIRLRHADAWIGLLVILAAVVFLGLALQAGILRDWFRPVSKLRIVLPETGVAGLSEGAEVQVLGTRGGVVRRIVVSPSQQMYAEADIDDQARAFIRRDSTATIRKSFGIAGAAFVDISRGSGAPLDWSYAVIPAKTERDPAESVGALFDQLREKVFPILDDASRAMRALAAISERIEAGQGNAGILLNDDSLARDLGETAAEARAIMTELRGTTRELAAIVRTARSGVNDVPPLLKRADATLATLQRAINDLARAAAHTPQLTENLEVGSQGLGSLLIQTQQTARELELLLVQMRGLWLLGGNSTPPTERPARLPPTEIRP